MIEKTLEIIIITYNRANCLENTLKQLLKSPFYQCKFTILDNCSKDDTPYICNKYKNIFSNMIVVRHQKNIGGSINILRAVETSTSKYTWILCDDDFYDFSDCNDLIETIESEKFDLLSPGSSVEYDWERGLATNVKELINRGASYFYARSFVPSTIFKTELFDSLCVFKGYENAHNLFPLFPFINKSMENNFSIYISKKNIIIPGQNNIAAFSMLEFILKWIKSCSMIKDRNIRINTIHEVNKNKNKNNTSFITKVCFSIAYEKIINNEDALKNYLSLITSTIIAFGFNKNIMIIFLIIPLILIPKFIFRILIQFYVYLKYDLRGKEVPKYTNFIISNEKNVDPFRKF